MWRSVPHTAVAITLTRTSPGPGTGTGTSRISVASRPAAGFVLTTACIFVGRVIPRPASRRWSFARFVATHQSPASWRHSVARLIVPDEGMLGLAVRDANRPHVFRD